MRSLVPHALALVAALACACSEEQQDEPILRVLDHAGEGAYSAEAAGGGGVRVDTRGGPDEGWFAVAVANLVMEERRPSGAEVDGDGRLLLGPEGGAWIRLFEVEPGEVLHVRGELDGDHLGTDFAPPFANLGLIEFDDMPRREDLPILLRNPEGSTVWTPNYPFHPGSGEPELIVPLGPRTRAAALVLLFTGREGAEEARVAYSNLVVRRAESADRRAALVGAATDASGPGALAVGEVEIGMMTRPSLCLLAGDEASIPVALPHGEFRLELQVGIPPAEDDPLHPEPGRRLTVACELWPEGREAPVVELTTELESKPFGDGRWTGMSAVLPEETGGRRARLVFRVRGADDLGGVLPAAVFGDPRVVPGRPRRVGPNVVLVSIDTLRADRLGCYGYGRDTSPNLDAFAREARVYTDVWANACYTLPSHMSMLTGQMPSMHTVVKPGFLRDPARSPLLAELLLARGYTTAAFTGGVFVDREFGFAAGFESYGAVDLIQQRDSKVTDHRIEEVPGLTRELVEENDLGRLEAWLEEHRQESFFLFFHTYAAHEFDPPERHRRALGFEGSLSEDEESQGLIGGGGLDPTPAQVARLDDLYDGGVRFADEGVGRLLATLERLELLDSSIVVVTADHGKEIGEHGIVGHGHALYEELLQVPLLLRLPPSLARRFGFAEPDRDGRPAMLVDIAPTVLEALDFPAPPHLQGHSLLGPAPDSRVRLAEVENLAVKYARRQGPIKTIYNPLDAGVPIPNTVEEETFDLDADPGERHALAPDPTRVARVREEFARLKALSAALGETREGGELSASTRAQLDALGYAEDAKRK